ncbi:hypothetical protein [Nostoc sp.]|uniref:hypothetical protein n=1 Tax=Nostoc sp. TaxID=1180 RepID=UPI002FF44C09
MSPQSLEIWKKLHWSFFSMIQALNIGLQRFEQAMINENLALAQAELESAATLMLASGAAMELAASFNPVDYDQQIRPTMIPPHVESHDLGLPETIENPDVGEVIYVAAESGEVMCRRWNWRNGDKTRITETTQAIVMNIDVLGENSEDRAITTRNSVAEMLAKFCQAHVQTTLLSPENPSYQLEN